jgi:hypothetical protein
MLLFRLQNSTGWILRQVLVCYLPPAEHLSNAPDNAPLRIMHSDAVNSVSLSYVQRMPLTKHLALNTS